jgi:hypothetical protein
MINTSKSKFQYRPCRDKSQNMPKVFPETACIQHHEDFDKLLLKIKQRCREHAPLPFLQYHIPIAFVADE